MQELGSLVPWFACDMDRTKATWHANRVLQLADEMTMGSNNHRNNRRVKVTHISSAEHKLGQTGEAPHYCHTVFFASLVLWWASPFECDTGLRDGLDLALFDADCLQRGVQLLSRSDARVAVAFQDILQSLISLSEPPSVRDSASFMPRHMFEGPWQTTGEPLIRQ